MVLLMKFLKTGCILALSLCHYASADLTVSDIIKVTPPGSAEFLDKSFINDYAPYSIANNFISAFAALTGTSLIVNAMANNQSSAYAFDLNSQQYTPLNKNHSLSLIATGVIPAAGQSVSSQVIAALNVVSTHKDGERLHPKAAPVTLSCDGNQPLCQLTDINPGSYFTDKLNFPDAGAAERVLAQSGNKRITYYYSLDDSDPFKGNSVCKTRGCSVLSYSIGDSDPIVLRGGTSKAVLFYQPDLMRVLEFFDGTDDDGDTLVLYVVTDSISISFLFKTDGHFTPLGLSRDGSQVLFKYASEGKACMSMAALDTDFIGTPVDCDIEISGHEQELHNIERITLTDDGQFGILNCSGSLSANYTPCYGFVYEAKIWAITRLDQFHLGYSQKNALMPVAIKRTSDQLLEVGMLVSPNMAYGMSGKITEGAVVRFKIQY